MIDKSLSCTVSEI